MATKNYWTFQITFHQPLPDGLPGLNFQNCSDIEIAEHRKNVWSIGIKVQTSNTCWEIISPFMIKQCFIIRQDRKH